LILEAVYESSTGNWLAGLLAPRNRQKKGVIQVVAVNQLDERFPKGVDPLLRRILPWEMEPCSGGYAV